MPVIQRIAILYIRSAAIVTTDEHEFMINHYGVIKAPCSFKTQSRFRLKRAVGFICIAHTFAKSQRVKLAVQS